MLEAVGLLLLFLTNPTMLVNKHIVLHVENMAWVFGFENRKRIKQFAVHVQIIIINCLMK